MSPLRRRVPDVFDHGSNLKVVSAAGLAPASVRLEDECLICLGHGSNLKLVSAAGFAPAIPRSQAERVAPTLRADGGLEGSCTLNPPADNGALC